MENQQGGESAPFKDHYQTLQLHANADAEMLDAAYWHLSRRHSEERATEPEAKQKQDALNEAYSILRSAELRAEYDLLRASVLGADALPVAPQPAPEPLPLTVMEKGRTEFTWPAETGPSPEPARRAPRLTASAIQHGLTAVVILALAGAALASWGQPVLVAALLVAGVAFGLIPLSRSIPKLALPTLSTTSSQRSGETIPPHRPEPARFNADELRQATGEMRARLRQGGAQDRGPASRAPAASNPLRAEAITTTGRRDNAA